MIPYEELDFANKIKYHTGLLLIAIGEGRFTQEVYSMCNQIALDAFNKGKEEASKG